MKFEKENKIQDENSLIIVNYCQIFFSYTSFHSIPNQDHIPQILLVRITGQYDSFWDSVSSRYFDHTCEKRPFSHVCNSLSSQYKNCSYYMFCDPRKLTSTFMIALSNYAFSSTMNVVAHTSYELPQFSCSVTNSLSRNTRFVISYLDELHLLLMDEASNLWNLSFFLAIILYSLIFHN